MRFPRNAFHAVRLSYCVPGSRRSGGFVSSGILFNIAYVELIVKLIDSSLKHIDAVTMRLVLLQSPLREETGCCSLYERDDAYRSPIG